MADLKFHRGTHQIGGCCTEISANGERILIDLGANLPDSDETDILRDWFADGGNTTAAEFLDLSSEDKYRVMDILGSLAFYKEVSAGQRNFVLVHAGLGDFSPENALSDYTLEELIYERPDMRR